MKDKLKSTIISILLGIVMGLMYGHYRIWRDAEQRHQCLRIEQAFLEGVKAGRKGGDYEERWGELERELCK